MISQREIYEADRAADRIHLRKVFKDTLRIVPLQETLADGDRQLLISALKFVSAIAFARVRKLTLVFQELASTSASPDILHIYQQHLDLLLTSANLAESSAANCGLEDLTDKVVRIGDVPVAKGAISSIWSGELYGKSVSIYSSMFKYKPEKNDLKSLEVDLVHNSI